MGREIEGRISHFFVQCSLKVDPSSLVLEFHFYGHGVKSAQGAVSITVDLGGASKKLSVLDQTHGVGHHPATAALAPDFEIVEFRMPTFRL